MRRLLQVVIFSALCLFFYSPSPAQADFSTRYDLVYTLDQSGQAKVVHDVQLTNTSANVFATKYSIIVTGQSPTNVSAKDSQGILPSIVLKNSDGYYQITVNLNEPVVGKGQSQSFTLYYQLQDVFEQTGRISQVRIPHTPLGQGIDNLNIRLELPTSFGKPAYISPPQDSLQTKSNLLILNFHNPKQAINVALGEFQVYNLSLTYHLANPTHKSQIQKIALPPDTVYQRIYLDRLDPKPTDVSVDFDGNWEATYLVPAQKQLDISYKASAHVYAHPQTFPLPTTDPSRYLGQSPYWPTTDPQIKKIAATLKSPRDIYDYVVKTLEYDYSKLTQVATRQPSTQTLSAPDKAACLEFTDLFVTLSRAAGIPAREINGFGYTTNSQLRPLSLVTDVLHAWPEYFDSTKNQWIQVDPTWADTTKGQDYFNKLDTEHITFAIHGLDPVFPRPAGDYKTTSEPTKDITITTGSYQDYHSLFGTHFSISSPLSPLWRSPANVTIQNQSAGAIYNLSPQLSSPSLTIDYSPQTIAVIPPLGQNTIAFSARSQNLLLTSNPQINLSLNDQQFAYTVPHLQLSLIYAIIPLSIIAFIVFLYHMSRRHHHDPPLSH